MASGSSAAQFELAMNVGSLSIEGTGEIEKRIG